MKTQTKLGLCALFAGALLAAAPSAQAISYDLTSDHVTGGAGTPPFGTVTLTQNGTSVDVTVTLNAGYGFVRTGAGAFQDFLFSGTGVALADITVAVHNPALVAATQGVLGYHADGTGDFTFGINAPTQDTGGGSAFSNPITFTVASATIAELTVPNANGNIFVADIIAPNGNTGPVDASTPNVPDGGTTATLLGLGLLGLGFMRRRAARVA